MSGLIRVCRLVDSLIKLKITHLSIKKLTITILIVMVFFVVLVSLVSGEYFFKAAREAQLYSLNRVIQVATRDIVRSLEEQAYDVATTLSVQGDIPVAFSKAIEADNSHALIEALDDPFITGFVGVYTIELIKVRAYDLELQFVAESSNGVLGLPQKMPEILYQQSRDRKGVMRSKALFGLWQHADKSYCSVLVPLGGVFTSGYLEIVVNPVHNLSKLSEKMSSPISIRSGIDPNKTYHEPETSISGLLPVEYVLETESGSPAYILTSYEDIEKLTEAVNTTVFNTIFMFLSLIAVVLFVALWLFRLFLFVPMNMMLEEIRHITDGDISRDLHVNGLAEVATLAEEFNKMTKEIRSREKELTRLSVIDGLTKIANRRKFDEVLNSEFLIAFRTEKPLSVLMIDIDYFKLFNDTYGHLAGDECLKKVAAALQRAVSRPADLVARYGGEEFAIILPNTDECGERVIAEKIMSEISTLAIAHSCSEIADVITVSIGGYTLVPRLQRDPVFIVAEADKSLYLAKAAGRNRFVLRS